MDDDYGREIVVSHEYGYNAALGLWLPKAVSSDGSQVVNIGIANQLSTLDNGPAWTSYYGVNGQGVVGNFFGGLVAITNAPGPANRLVIDDIIFSSSVQCSLTFTEETTGLVIYKVYLPVDGDGQFTTRGEIKLSTANKRLMCQASATGNHFALAVYHLEA